MTPAGLVALATRIGNEELADNAELLTLGQQVLVGADWVAYVERRQEMYKATEQRLHELLNAIGEVAPQLGGGA